jgi:hypothetical protein
MQIYNPYIAKHFNKIERSLLYAIGSYMNDNLDDFEKKVHGTKIEYKKYQMAKLKINVEEIPDLRL